MIRPGALSPRVRMLIDRHLPTWDVQEVHALEVRAMPDDIEPLLDALDLSGSRVIRFLFALRGLPTSSLRLDGMKRLGFQVLDRAPAGEVVLGLIGRFWRWREGPRRFAPAEFRDFSDPGWAKAAWNFRTEPLGPGRTLLQTETRVLCTDEESRRRFLRYWRAVRPFSGLVRREALRGMRRAAEARAAG